jgi:ribose transport system substrate-binding protein
MIRGARGRLRIAVAISASVAVTGCTIGVASALPASSRQESSSRSAQSTRVVAAAEKALSKYEKMPKFVPPNPPFNVSPLKGKTVELIGINLTTPALNYAIAGAQQAAKVVGIHTTVFDGKNDPSLWTEGIQQGISSHVSAIGLYGVPTGLVESQLKAAAAAGIPVVNVENNQPNAAAKGQGAGPNVYAAASESFALESTLAADAAIIQTKGHAKAVIMNTPTITPSPSIVAGYEATLKKCPGCSVVKKTTIQIATWATGLGPQTTSTLQANPGANVILPLFDTMALFIVPAVVGANDTGKVTVQSTSGFPSAASLMAKFPKVLTGLVGQSDYWSGWLSLNQMMRGMSHLKPGNPVVPARYITPALVKKLGTSEAALYGNSFVKGFEKLWKRG